MKQADTQVDQRLKELYGSLGVKLSGAEQLQSLDSLGLIYLIDKIEQGFGIRIGLVDLDPVKMKQHSYIVQMVNKYGL